MQIFFFSLSKTNVSILENARRHKSGKKESRELQVWPSVLGTLSETQTENTYVKDLNYVEIFPSKYTRSILKG